MIEFGVLGPVTVHRDGEAIALRATVRRLLAVLLCRPGRYVTDTDLVDALWGNEVPVSPRKAVQLNVHRLRQALGDERVVRGPHGYLAAITPDELDSARFAGLVADGQAAHQHGDLERASALFDQATALWRGDAFADVTGGPVVTEAARLLTEQLLSVREQRYGIELDLDRHTRIIAELTALANAHPYREHARELLMLALYRSGRQAEALTVFQETRTLFVERLGVDPSPSLQRLHEAVLRGDERLDRITVAGLADARVMRPSAPRAASPVPRQLPNDVAGFTGRGDMLRLLDSRLDRAAGEAATVAISVIEGTAGVGKTALAVHWAHRVAHRLPDGQLYLNLRGYAAGVPMPPIEALAQFLRALGTPPEQVPTDLDEAAALYRSLLAGRSMLILLDNAGSADQVRPLLPAESTCLVLVTSRERLRSLAVRDGASRLALDVLDHDDAVALLARHVGAERVAEEPDATAELARLCAYLPLALRIASADLAEDPHSAVATYAGKLAGGNRLAALATDDDQQVAVSAAFDLSYHAMPAGSRRLFRLLGLAPGPDITPSAAAVLADLPEAQATDLLDRLARAHLLEEHAPGRFLFHDLLRLYANERAHTEEPAAGAEAATARLLEWYLRVADTAARSLYPHRRLLPLRLAPTAVTGHDSVLDWLDQERPNLVAAVRYAAEHGAGSTAWQLSDALSGYFWMRLHGIDWLTVARSGLAAAEAAADSRGQIAMLISLGSAHMYLGDFHEAAARHTQAVTLARQARWPEGLASALGYLGIATWQSGRLPDAVEHLTQALEVNRRAARRAAQAANLGDLGSVHYEMGRLRESTELNIEALAIEREIGNRIGEAIKLANLAEARHALGASSSAWSDLTTATRIIRDAGQLTVEPEFLRLIATVHRDAGRSAEAVAAATAALAANETSGYARGQADALNTLGTVYQGLGRCREALVHHERALELSLRTEARYPEAEALIGLAETRRELGDLDLAEGHAEQAVALTAEIGYRMLEGQARTAMAGIDLRRGRDERAVGQARHALRTHRETGYRLGESRALAVLGAANRPVT